VYAVILSLTREITVYEFTKDWWDHGKFETKNVMKKSVKPKRNDLRKMILNGVE